MILAALSLLSLHALQEEPSTDRGRRDPLDQAIEDLGSVGIEIDRSVLFIETAKVSWATKDLDAQQSYFFEPGHFHALWVLYRAIGHEADSPEAFRRQVASALARGLVAYYAFERDGLVQIDNAVGSFANDAHVFVHELVHAWQDQQRDLEKVYAEPETFEATRALQCLIEGEAEAIAHRVALERRGIDSTEGTSEGSDNTLAKLTVGAGMASMYAAGREFCLRHVRKNGWEALPRIYDEPLPSTEEILHPAKLGKDRPVEVGLPDWPAAWGGAELIHEDTLGELGIFGILNDGLRIAGGSELEAQRAAIGWDGDRYRCWRLDSGERVFAWHLVFDRELDAEQFESTWKRISRGRTSRSDRSVTWVLAEDRAKELAELLVAHAPVPDAVPGDAASTQALEDELPVPDDSKEAHVAGGRWHLPAHGFSLPLPADGWQARDVQGTSFLVGQTTEGFAENINVAVLPLAPGKDVEALLEENRSFFESEDSFRLHSCDLREVHGTRVVYLTYGASMRGRDLEFRALLFPRENQQIVITATLLNSQSEASAPRLDAALLGLRFER